VGKAQVDDVLGSTFPKLNAIYCFKILRINIYRFSLLTLAVLKIRITFT